MNFWSGLWGNTSSSCAGSLGIPAGGKPEPEQRPKPGRDTISPWACPLCILQKSGLCDGKSGHSVPRTPLFCMQSRSFTFTRTEQRNTQILVCFHLQNNLAGLFPALLEAASVPGELRKFIADTIPLSSLFFTTQTHRHASTELPQPPHQLGQPRAAQPENQSHAGYLQMSLHLQSPWVSRWRNASQQIILWLRTSLKKMERDTNKSLSWWALIILSYDAVDTSSSICSMPSNGICPTTALKQSTECHMVSWACSDMY